MSRPGRATAKVRYGFCGHTPWLAPAIARTFPPNACALRPHLCAPSSTPAVACNCIGATRLPIDWDEPGVRLQRKYAAAPAPRHRRGARSCLRAGARPDRLPAQPVTAWPPSSTLSSWARTRALPPRAEPWHPAISVLPSNRALWGAGQPWAEPVRGSSGLPAWGRARSRARVATAPRCQWRDGAEHWGPAPRREGSRSATPLICHFTPARARKTCCPSADRPGAAPWEHRRCGLVYL